MRTDHHLRRHIEPLAPSWRSWAGIHGGYSLARAAQAATEDRSLPPRIVHGSFVAPVPAERELTVDVETLNAGRSGSSVRGEVRDGHRLLLSTTVRVENSQPGPFFDRFPAPQVPPPEDCTAFALPADLVPFGGNLVIRPATGALPLAGGAEPELVAWIRLLDASLQPWQAVTVLLDALPPALYAVATVPAAVPTVAFAATLLDGAATWDSRGWALVRIRTDLATAGWAVDTSWAWDAAGLPLGHATQQRKVLGPLHHASTSG